MTLHGFSDSVYETGDRGWIEFEPSMVGIDEVILTQTGADVGAAFRAKQQDVRSRYKAVVDGLLAWVADRHYVVGSAPNIADFRGNDKGSYLGSKFTETVIPTLAPRMIGMAP